MRADDDPRFVAMLRDAWTPSVDLAALLVGAEDADRLAVGAFGRVLERWHRVVRSPDPVGRAVAETAVGCVRQARREGTSVRRAEPRPDSLLFPAPPSAGHAVPLDPVLRSAISAMAPRVGAAYALRHLAGFDDDRLADALATSRRRARRRVARGEAVVRRLGGRDGDVTARA